MKQKREISIYKVFIILSIFIKFIVLINPKNLDIVSYEYNTHSIEAKKIFSIFFHFIY